MATICISLRKIFFVGPKTQKKKDFKTLNICLLFFGEKFKKKKGGGPFIGSTLDETGKRLLRGGTSTSTTTKKKKKKKPFLSFFLSFFRDDVNDRG